MIDLMSTSIAVVCLLNISLRHSCILCPTSDEWLTLTAQPNNDGVFGYDKHCAASRNLSVVNGNLNNDGSGELFARAGSSENIYEQKQYRRIEDAQCVEQQR
jgi:hypothetical protein